jgi:hypothetical protein
MTFSIGVYVSSNNSIIEDFSPAVLKADEVQRHAAEVGWQRNGYLPTGDLEQGSDVPAGRRQQQQQQQRG